MTHATMGTRSPAITDRFSGDRLCLAPFLGTYPRICPLRVDEGDDRRPELLRQPHEALGLAVTLRVRRTEVAQQVLAHISTLLVTEGHHRRVVESHPSTDNGGVVPEDPVPLQFHEVGADALDVVEC